MSSAASAANAAVNTVYKLTHPTPAGDWFSVGVHSDGSYGIPEGVIYSYPVTVGKGEYRIVPGLAVDDFSRQRMEATHAELREERDGVRSLLA